MDNEYHGVTPDQLRKMIKEENPSLTAVEVEVLLVSVLASNPCSDTRISAPKLYDRYMPKRHERNKVAK